MWLYGRIHARTRRQADNAPPTSATVIQRGKRRVLSCGGMLSRETIMTKLTKPARDRIPGVELVVAKPTNRLGRKEPNDDYYRSRFPSRVSTNRFAQHYDRRGRGKTAGTSRRGGEVLPCSRDCGRDSAHRHG